jgi:hypothetical protein
VTLRNYSYATDRGANRVPKRTLISYLVHQKAQIEPVHEIWWLHKWMKSNANSYIQSVPPPSRHFDLNFHCYLRQMTYEKANIMTANL